MSERPNQSISYTDLRSIGWNIDFKPNYTPSGGDVTYKVSRMSLNGREVYEADLEKALNTLGLDLNRYHYQVDKKIHKPLTTGREASDYRFVAPERVDDSWLDSGCASQEALVCGSNFLDLDKYLAKMRRGGDRE